MSGVDYAPHRRSRRGRLAAAATRGWARPTLTETPGLAISRPTIPYRSPSTASCPFDMRANNAAASCSSSATKRRKPMEDDMKRPQGPVKR